MVNERRRIIHYVDPPSGRLDPPIDDADEEPVREVLQTNDESNARIKACEEELQRRREAITALTDVVMKQRATIQSMKAEKHHSTAEPTTFPPGDVRGETASKTSTLSGSGSSEESTSTAEVYSAPKPTIGFEQSRPSQEEEEEMSAITCEEECSIDSSNFLKMEHEMQVMIESLKEQAVSPFHASPLDTVISFETPMISRQDESTKSVGNDGIKGVIESIQEQASHVDAVIALEKLQTTKNELQAVMSELRNRNTEVGEFKNQIKVLECQIATLELERDLHMAEATRARDDLKDCIQFIVKQSNRENEDDSRRGSTMTEPTPNIRISHTQSCGFVTPEKPSASAATIRPSHSGTSNGDKSTTKQTTPLTQLSESTHQSVLLPDDHSMSSFSSDGHPRRNLALCFWTQRGKEVIDSGPAFERMDDNAEPKRVRLFRRRSKNQKKKDKSSSISKDSRLTSSQRAHQAMIMDQCLANAESEADDLRIRLHSITRYYDNIVISLQQSAGSNNTEYEADMINQLSFLDREKRAVMDDLREKDAVIARHQRAIAELVGDPKDCSKEASAQERVLFV